VLITLDASVPPDHSTPFLHHLTRVTPSRCLASRVAVQVLINLDALTPSCFHEVRPTPYLGLHLGRYLSLSSPHLRRFHEVPKDHNRPMPPRHALLTGRAFCEPHLQVNAFTVNCILNAGGKKGKKRADAQASSSSSSAGGGGGAKKQKT